MHRDRLRDGKRFLAPNVDVRDAGAFYESLEWQRVRYEALKRHGGRCQCCGLRWRPEAPLHVDHIKPRSRFPDLALEVSNLQVLCGPCNRGKGASDYTDWRAA